PSPRRRRPGTVEMHLPRGGHTMSHIPAVDPVRADCRRGEVVEVIRNGDREEYRIRWEDGQESLYRPACCAPLADWEDVAREQRARWRCVDQPPIFEMFGTTPSGARRGAQRLVRPYGDLDAF